MFFMEKKFYGKIILLIITTDQQFFFLGFNEETIVCDVALSVFRLL